jgi:hypothetical protein
MSVASKSIEIKNVVISFVKIYEPVPKMSGTGNEYSLQVIISKDHPQLQELKDAIVAIRDEAFPNTAIPSDCLLLRDSDAEGKGAQYEYMENTFFFNVRRNENQGKVPCAMPDGSLFDANPQIIFSGCIANVWVNLYDYQVFQPGTNRIMKRGVTGALNGVQLVDNVNVVRLGGAAPMPQFGVVENANVNAVLGEGHTAQRHEGAPQPQAVPNNPATDVPW